MNNNHIIALIILSSLFLACGDNSDEFTPSGYTGETIADANFGSGIWKANTKLHKNRWSDTSLTIFSDIYGRTGHVEQRLIIGEFYYEPILIRPSIVPPGATHAARVAPNAAFTTVFQGDIVCQKWILDTLFDNFVHISEFDRASNSGRGTFNLRYVQDRRTDCFPDLPDTLTLTDGVFNFNGLTE